MQHRLLLFLLPLFSHLLGSSPPLITEGFYQEEPISKTMFWLARYLPYDPKIAILDEMPKDDLKYTNTWPEGTFLPTDPLTPSDTCNADLLWVNSEGAELCFLTNASSLLQKAKAIYTSTHFFHEGAYYGKLKQLLESFGFKLLIHWYIEDREGTAIFVKNNLLEAERNCLNCSSLPINGENVPSPPLEIRPFLQPVCKDGASHGMEGIDFIYMINLDERPEKFARAATELHFYDIHPCRFSAVNGWKLSIDTFNTIGIPFIPSMIQTELMGSYFTEQRGRIYRSNELMKTEGRTYYPLGISQGAVGIILSHLSVLQDAYDAGYETIWVMEDDVEALSDPRELSDLIRKLDAQVDMWDILFTDTDTKSEDGVHIPCRAMAARPNMNGKPLDYFLQQFYKVDEDFSRTGMRYGAYSMILRRSGIKKILNYYRTYRLFLPYDMDFWLSFEMNMYCTNKDLVSHRSHSFSDNGYPTYE